VPKAFYSLNKIQGRDKRLLFFSTFFSKGVRYRLRVSNFSKNYDTVAAVAFEVAGT